MSIRRRGLLDISNDFPWSDFGEVVDGVVQLLEQKWTVLVLEKLLVDTRAVVFRARLRVACEDAGVVLELVVTVKRERGSGDCGFQLWGVECS